MASVGVTSVLAFALSTNVRSTFATGAPLLRTCPEIEPTQDRDPSLLLLSTTELLSPDASVVALVSGVSVGAGVAVAAVVGAALRGRFALRVGVAGASVLVAVIVGLASVGAGMGVGFAATSASVTPLSKSTAMLAGLDTKSSAIRAAICSKCLPS